MENNQDKHDTMTKMFLEWRDINTELGDIVCTDCGGSGKKGYSCTSSKS